MIEEKVVYISEIKSGIRRAAEKNGNAPDSQKRLEDLFGDQSRSENTNVAGMLAAFVCLTVGSGSEDV